MKKVLVTLAMMLTLGQVTGVTAQNNQKPPQELVDSTQTDGQEAYSDTTSVAKPTTVVRSSHDDEEDVAMFEKIFGHSDNFGGFDMNGMMGMTFVLAIILIIFVIAPVLILAVLFFFIYKNRRQKMQLAQMAVQNGQPIPGELLKDTPDAGKDVYQAGLRQVFLGLGLMVFLGYTAGQVGFGIGALVFFIGLGKVVIARTSNKNNINNPSNI